MAALSPLTHVAVASQSVCVPSTSNANSRSVFQKFSGLSLVKDVQSTCSSGRNVGGVCMAERLTIESVVKTRREGRAARHRRIRKKLSGTTERPRLAVFRSNQHLYAQVIDDTKSHTLAAASTQTPAIRDEMNLTSGPNVESARRVGQEIAKICLERGIKKVAFDRGGFVYHGRVQALAEAAREGGLDF
eukprot:TRINITY_DN2702_c0_g1_i1.p1 TRINITY_DN2702_c0_g1~~TRINITY_DN2702_c0_g1_i1.p1  ORF type:complete len:199 (+),score=41.40 TRINITY_DN2702_c0_g1_i1:31-597(+)